MLRGVNKMVAPKLRFRDENGGEFGDWEEHTLADIAHFLDNQRVPLSELERTARKGEHPYYGASGIIDYIDDFIFDGEYVLLGEDGANILTRSSRLAFVISGKCWVNNHAHVIKAKGSNYFLAEALERISYGQYNSGTVQPKLNIKSCLGIKLKTPEVKEQTKIANFLSKVDERTQQISQIHTLLMQYKKSVMQKIFRQELRFKDENGKEFGEWEEKAISDLAEINPKSKELPDRFIYIDLESVQNGQLLKENTIFKTEAPSRAQRVLVENDVLFQLVRPYQKNNFLFKYQGVYVASTGYAQLRARGSAEFLYQLIHFDDFTTEVINKCTGTSYPAINSSDLAKIEIRVPCLCEQTKIATFLSAIDDKINQAQSQLTALQEYKRGLLQQMFV